MPAQIARVSSGTVSSKRAANCSARSTRRLSSANVRGSTTRSTPAARSARPPNGILVRAGERVPRNRVDGEVAPPGRLAQRHRRDRPRPQRPCARVPISTRVAAARRRCRRPCRRESCARPAPPGRTARAAQANRSRGCRRSRGPRPSTPRRAAGRAPSRRRRARGRPRGGRARAIARANRQGRRVASGVGHQRPGSSAADGPRSPDFRVSYCRIKEAPSCESRRPFSSWASAWWRRRMH